MVRTVNLDPIFQQAGEQVGIDPDLLRAHAKVESGMNPSAISPQGAIGLMQFMPATAKAMGIDPTDPVQSIFGAARLIKQNLGQFDGDLEQAVAAYHGGPDQAQWGPKTRAYVGKVADAFQQIKQNAGIVQADDPVVSAMSNDPVMAAMNGPPAQPDMSSDPVMAAMTSKPTTGAGAGRGFAVPSTGAGAGRGFAVPSRPEDTSNGSDFARAVIHHAGNFPHGIAQGIENAVDWLAQKLPDNAISQAIHSTVQQDNAAMRQREAEYQSQVPNSNAAYAGAAVGEVAPWLMAGPAKALTSIGEAASTGAARLPWIGGKITQAAAGGAAQGLVMGAAQPVTGPTDYGEQKSQQVKMGALLGAAIPGGIQTAKSTYGALKNVTQPIFNPTAAATESILSASKTPLENLSPQKIGQAAAEIVPGSVPTTAQVAGSPELVQLEKAFGNTPEGKAALMARELQNNNARVSQLESIAKTDADLTAAKAVRDQVATPFIKAMQDPKTSAPVNAAPILAELDKLENSSFSTDPVVSRTISALRSQLSEAAGKTNIAEYGLTPEAFKSLDPLGNNVRPDLLDGIRQNLRSIIADNATNGIVRSKQEAALSPLADSIVGAIESANPGYRSYLATYAKLSEPIRDIEAAKSILEGFAGGRDTSGNPIISLTRYNSLLTKALKGDYGVSPQTEEALKAVQADLQRSSISSSIRTPGSDTIYNAKARGLLPTLMYGENFKGGFVPKATGAAVGSLIGGAIGHPIYGAGIGATAASKLSSMAGNRYSEALSELLLNPYSASQALEAQAPSGVALSNLIKRTPLLSGVR
jgi:hypothetical protein